MNDMIEIGIIRQNISILLLRAATDTDFRALCQQDASKAYMELTGQVLPKQYMVRLFEQDERIEGDGPIRCMRLPKHYPKTWLG